MKIIIAGSRNLKDVDYESIYTYLLDFRLFSAVEEVVSGTARGVDQAGEDFGTIYGIGVKKFPADWNKHGRAAGPLRNRDMAEYADALLLIWDGESRGSANMKKEMIRLNKPIYEVILRKI